MHTEYHSTMYVLNKIMFLSLTFKVPKLVLKKYVVSSLSHTCLFVFLVVCSYICNQLSKHRSNIGIQLRYFIEFRPPCLTFCAMANAMCSKDFFESKVLVSSFFIKISLAMQERILLSECHILSNMKIWPQMSCFQGFQEYSIF